MLMELLSTYLANLLTSKERGKAQKKARTTVILNEVTELGSLFEVQWREKWTVI